MENSLFSYFSSARRGIQRSLLTRTWGVVPFNPASAKRRIEKEADIVAALLSPIIRSSRIFPAFPTNPNSCCTMDENYIYIYLREEVLKRNNENVKNRWLLFNVAGLREGLKEEVIIDRRGSFLGRRAKTRDDESGWQIFSRVAERVALLTRNCLPRIHSFGRSLVERSRHVCGETRTRRFLLFCRVKKNGILTNYDFRGGRWSGLYKME